VDLHIQAFKIAEEMSMPVMVCMDGFILTHAYEQVDIPTAEEVAGFLPPFVPRQQLDPADPVSIGAMVGPESFMEVKYLAHQRMIDSERVVKRVAEEFEAHFGRKTGGLLRTYRAEGAETVVLALGSIIGTLKDVIDELQLDGHSIGVLGLTSFRPFPYEALAIALKDAKRVIILEKAFSTGTGGIVTLDVTRAIEGMDIQDLTLIAGLGGRPITIASLKNYLLNAMKNNVDRTTFLDLEVDTVEIEVNKERAMR
jgi:pyruvate ferredoxin oxidoreductase alpha subunit